MAKKNIPLSTAELQKAVAAYQSGIGSDIELDTNFDSGDDLQFDDEPPSMSFGTHFDEVLRRPLNGYLNNDYTEEARAAGYGTSRYDNTEYTPGQDLEQNRALEQSRWAKLGSGLAKGGVTAVATAINTTAGTVFGLGSALFELAADTNNDGNGLRDAVDAGTNNWLSNQLVKLQNWSEEVLPNYRTQEERSEKYQKEWYKHMGTANFIGDSILKNFGFTVGAMVGGMAWTRLIGAGLAKTVAGDIMKGAVAAAEGDAEAGALLQEAAEAIAAGKTGAARRAIRDANKLAKSATAAVNTDKVVANIRAAGKAVNKYGAKMALYGAVIGAMGEGTVEGIMARNEFMNEFNDRLQRSYYNEYNGIEDEILHSGNYDWVTFRQQVGPDESLDYRPQLTTEGKRELARRQQAVIDKYQKMAEQAETEGDHLASTTYLLNLPILTTSNVIQFGRMFSGGWKTARNAASSAVKGQLATEAGEKGALKLVGNYASKYGKGAITGRTVLGSLKMAGSEAFEEMAQGTVSSGAKAVADSHLSAFNDAGYDAEAIGSVRDWFLGMYTGGKEYLGDIKNWQEGAIGALTGLFGIPGRHWNGGVAEAYRTAKKEVTDSRSAADRLNEEVNSEKFQTRWHNYIRHLAFDNEMEEAIQANDQYAWKSANDAQLINDIMMFADAGKLDDLRQLVSEYGNITEEQAKEILELAKGEDGELPAYLQKKSPSDMAKSVKEQSEEILKKIDEYKDFYDVLSARAPLGSSEEFLKEMVFTAQQIKGFEERYLDMLDKTMEATKNIISQEEESVREPLAAAIRRAFSGGFPIVNESVETLAAENALLNALEASVEQTKDQTLIDTVSDMRKLSDDRRSFYRKLVQLQSENGQEKFNSSAVTQSKVNDAADAAAVREETKDYKTISDVKAAYHAIKGEKAVENRKKFVDDLRSKKGANPAVDNFVELFDAVEGFRTKAMASQEDFLDSIGNPMAPWVKGIYGKMVRDLLLHNVNSIEDLQRLDPDAFASSSEMAKFADQFSSFGSPSESAVAARMAEIQNHLREVVEEYFKERNAASIAKSSKKIKSAVKQGRTKVPGLGTVGLKGKKTTEPEEPEPTGPEEPLPDEFSAERKRTEKDDSKKGTGVPATEGELEDLGIPPVAEPPVVDREAKTVDGKRRWFHGAFPEISVDRQKARRAAYEEENLSERKKLLAKKEAQLIDFDEDKDLPSDKAGEGEANNFSKMVKALKKHNAFDNRSLVRKGDKIKFVIFRNEDPDTGGFPMHEGRRPVLMCVEKVVGGEKRLLVVDVFLDDTESNAKKYFGLDSLYEAIDDEFAERGFDEEGKFVFSKVSPVWALRSGFIDYGPSMSDHKITDLPGYDRRAPIIFVERDGAISYMVNTPKGTPTDRKFSHVSELFPKTPASDLEGNFYYLAYDNDGYKVPIRLNQEHFNPETMTKGTSSPFVTLRETVGKIVTTVQNAEQNVPSTDPVPGETAEERKGRVKQHERMLAQYRKDLSGLIKDLDKVLDLHRDAITLGFNASDGKLSLKITPNAFSKSKKEGEEEEKAMYFYGADLTQENVLSGLASMNRAFNVSSSENGTSIMRKVDDGILTSNANCMRLKGIDFYVFPWFDADKAFRKGSAGQERIQKSDYSDGQAAPAAPESPSPAPNAPSGNKMAGKFKKGLSGIVSSEIVEREMRKSEEEKAREKHQRMVTEAESRGIPEENRDDVADALVNVASRGPVALQNVQLALGQWSRGGLLLSQDLKDFGTVLNSILSEQEKEALSSALGSAYHMSADKVNMFELMFDYVTWKLTGVFSKGKAEDRAVIEKAFKRLESVESYHEESASLVPRAFSVAGSRTNVGSAYKIGTVYDTSVFSQLSKQTQQYLLDRHWTEEEYNSAPEEIQDKALRCAGV